MMDRDDGASTQHYDAFGVCVKVLADHAGQLARIDRWLTVPKTLGFQAPDVQLVMHEAEPGGFDALIALPGREALKMQQELVLGQRNLQYSAYRNAEGIWSDYAGVCRTHIPSHATCATTVLNPEALDFRDYGEILAGVVPLNRLMRFFGLHVVHGSCVEVDGKGVLFVGQSFRGKSTAAYAMMRQGYPVLNDDRVLVWKTSDGYRVGTLSDVFKMREEALVRFFPELMEREPMGRLEGERLYKISETPGLRFSSNCRLHSLLMLDKTGMPDTILQDAHPARLVEELLPGSLSAFDSVWSRKSFEFLMEMMVHVPCGQVQFGTDMERFVKSVEGWIAKE